MNQAATHRVGVVTELPGVLRDLGHDPAPVLAAAGIDADMLRNPDNQISFIALGRLMHEAGVVSGHPHIGLLTGLRGGVETLGIVGRLMATAPTLREAILDLCTNQVRYIQGAVAYLAMHDDVAFWGYTVQSPPMLSLEAILDGAVGIGVALLRQLGTGPASEARLSRAAPARAPAYRAALDIPVLFDAEHTGLVLSAPVLDSTLPSADPVLRSLLQRQIAQHWARAEPTMTEQTRRVLAARVTAGEPDREQVAQALGISTRTLSRHLQDEGSSFRALLDGVRHDVACQLLRATRMPVTDVGIALGYAAPPAFVRAFRRAAGVPPSEWHRLMAGRDLADDRPPGAV